MWTFVKKIKFIKKFIEFFDKFYVSSNSYVQQQYNIIQTYNYIIEEFKPPNKPATNKILKSLALSKFSLKNLVRFGDLYDGGYLMAMPMNTTHAISIGIGKNISWDYELSLLGIKVLMFDHTIKKPRKLNSNMIFYRKGLGTVSSSKFFTLKEILELEDLKGAKDIILKIDIEGAEWNTLQQSNFDLGVFSEIIIEFHELNHNNLSQLALLEKLRQDFMIIHINPNSYSKFIKLDDYLLPNIIEVTYLRKDIYFSFENSDYSNLVYTSDPRLPAISNSLFKSSNIIS